MAQAFVSTYRNHYKWNKIKLRDSRKPHDRFTEDIIPDGDWVIQKNIHEDHEDKEKLMDEALETIRKAERRVLWSVYQKDYCNEIIANEESEGDKKYKEMMKAKYNEDLGDSIKSGNTDMEQKESLPKGESFENELLKYCKELYKSPKTQKILPPLPTSRRLFGYMKHSRMYTPLTNYQIDYGNIAFNILKDPNFAIQELPISDEETEKQSEKSSKEKEKNTEAKSENVEDIDKEIERLQGIIATKQKKGKKKQLDKVLKNMGNYKNYVNADCYICPCLT